ncbi:MAG: DUF2510 domain-containing protein, partial [Thermoplasmata archaeon]|nr:DUF2510 domain-containing protein [Thermoplasmata archaeon]
MTFSPTLPGPPAGPTLGFEERLGVRGRAWWWLLAIAAVAFFAIGPIAVPIALVAWFVNVGRYARVRTRIDDERLSVGRRSVPLAALDLSTVGRATNPWPWRVFSRRYLGANPIWTRDSLSVQGIDAGGIYRVAVGTNHRDELVAALDASVAAASEHHISTAGTMVASPPAWHPDPWAPTALLRWWDGVAWTGHT